jgi:uncharacterized protein (TIGR02466 family)
MINDIVNIFSPFYYKAPATEHQNIKSQYCRYFLKKYEENPNNQPKTWGCKVHTTFGRRDEKLDKIKDLYNNDVMRFFDQINMPPVKVDTSDVWFNVYGKGQWQESHHHHGNPDVYFSAVHLLKYNKEKHPPLIFNSPQHILMTPCNLGRYSNTGYWDLDHVVDANEGDIIIFPSFLEHQVNIQESDEERVTVSFNIKITPHVPQQYTEGQVIVEKGTLNGSYHEDYHNEMMQDFMAQMGLTL